MAKRWVIGGLAVGLGALMVAPEARTWLRRRLGLEPEDRRWFEEEGADAPEYEGDEPLDTREARFSLRARLSEDAPAEASAEEAESPPAAAAYPEPAPEPAPEEPAAVEPDPEPEHEPARDPYTAPAPIFGTPSYEAVPPVTPEADAPKAPGEDTDEVPPLPPANAWSPPAAVPAEQPSAEAPQAHEPAAEEFPPPVPPTMLRPGAPRPFSGESTSFRSAIDAARERVHEAAREATPDEGESTEPIDERS